MKTVWILNHYAKPPTSTGGSRHYQLAKHLKSHDWRAVLIASSVEHVSGMERLRSDEEYRHEVKGEVDFHWLKTTSYQGNGPRRIANMLSYTLQALRPSRTDRLPPPDVVIGSSVHPFAALAGWWLAKKHKVPFVFEVRDLWPQTLIDMGHMKEGSAAVKFMRMIEGFLYRRANKIITLLPFASEYLRRFGVPDNKVVWISNGVGLEDYPLPQSDPADPDGRPFQLMYYGSHGRANGLLTLIQAMSVVKKRLGAGEKRVHLRLIGEGLEKDILMANAHSEGLTDEWISFEPPVPKSEIPSLSASADAFIITVRDLPELYKYGISMNKLFDYLASSRPIIIASNARNNPVADAEAGITVPAEDPVALADAILEMSQMPPEQRLRLAVNGRVHVAKEYDYAVLARRLADTLNVLI